jgi:hypothetical protein
MLQDLAGSEKAVTDMERRGEGKHINQRYDALTIADYGRG